MTPLEITLLILVLTIVAFITGKIPFSVISAGIMLSLIMTGVMEPAEAFSGFINTNVVMFVAMFVIGAGLTKTSLIDKAEQLVVRYKDNPKMLIFLACIASSLLASITSATATAAIMIITQSGGSRPLIENQNVRPLMQTVATRRTAARVVRHR